MENNQTKEPNMSALAGLKELKQRSKIMIPLMVVFLTLVAACGGGNSVLPDGGNPYLSAKAGDTIQFGGLDWIVLTAENGKALILSEKILEERPYHSPGGSVTWEECSLREFLNGSFYDDTFSAQEKKRILETRLTNQSGNSTDDRVFLLSVDEVNEYMGDNAHTNMKNAKTAELLTTGAPSWWWLRSSPGLNSHYAANVNSDGNVYANGNLVRNAIGVRPALWLNL